jgi:hypothetical protein
MKAKIATTHHLKHQKNDHESISSPHQSPHISTGRCHHTGARRWWHSLSRCEPRRVQLIARTGRLSNLAGPLLVELD